MYKLVKNLKRILLILLVIAVILVYIGYSIGARVHYDDNPLAKNWNNEGPYIFFEEDNLISVSYLKGSENKDFVSDKQVYGRNELDSVKVYYPLDKSSFDVEIRSDVKTPPSIYEDANKILAISDIESNYKTFRDFLINNQVIDNEMKWIFGSNHLVLVGDFVDRGYFTTQVLWLIYKLEQEAEKHGGRVHYIIGNHEMKMMHGNYGATDPKFNKIAALLNKDEIDLYSLNSLLGKWLASKNTIEWINGYLFIHGGIHPEVAQTKFTIADINKIISNYYYLPLDSEDIAPEHRLFTQKETGLAWYRGYFKDNLTQEEVELGLEKFNAKAVVVGHTLQKRVNHQYEGKVIAIDVQHPNDDHKLWPEGHSEGLLIDGENYYRVLANGMKEKLN